MGKGATALVKILTTFLGVKHFSIRILWTATSRCGDDIVGMIPVTSAACVSDGDFIAAGLVR